jgi:hypothetical protein
VVKKENLIENCFDTGKIMWFFVSFVVIDVRKHWIITNAEALKLTVEHFKLYHIYLWA